MKGRILVDNEEYHNLRKHLVSVISHINSVANIDGINLIDFLII